MVDNDSKRKHATKVCTRMGGLLEENFAPRREAEPPLAARAAANGDSPAPGSRKEDEDGGKMAYCVFGATARCQNCSLKVVKRRAANAGPADAAAEVQAERGEREKVKLCGGGLFACFTSVRPCRLVGSPHFPPRNSPQFVRRASRTAGRSTG